jgi:DNA-binding NtrC family response regulator
MPRRRLLLVGGDSQVVAVIREYLDLDENLEVETVEYCDDALKLIMHRPFDLVLLLSLRAPWRTWPILSSAALHIGSESAILFLKQLRALHCQVPVIVVSGRLDAEIEVLRNGAFAFVQKPIILAQVDRVVASALTKDQSSC